MAVGGMIGGGIYTLAGVIVELAGPWAWVSILIGAVIALATVHSYAQLTIKTNSTGVPLTIFDREGHHSAARVLAWLLLVVYILALAVYTFTAGHYIGRALGFGRVGIVGIEVVLVSLLTVLNLLHVQHPARVQITAVWAELAILAALAGLGFWHWRPENLGAGVTAGSIKGVLVATASTFIAFEGFEMLAYDLRELERPRRIMRQWLPVAVIAVATAYIVVTIGAASLVGAHTLVEEKEAALAAAGRAAAGTIGMIVVTIAAFSSATSAINATLFSASRLARTAANHQLLPRWCAHCNQYDSPYWSTIAIAVGALVVAATLPLGMLVAVASLGFLSLFCLVNVLAVRRTRQRRWIAVLGAVGSGGAIVVNVATLGR
jgi:amino acid transporter